MRGKTGRIIVVEDVGLSWSVGAWLDLDNDDMGNCDELVVIMLLGTEGTAGENETIGIMGGGWETVAAALSSEGGMARWGMGIVTELE
jgi:hypothetical protein